MSNKMIELMVAYEMLKARKHKGQGVIEYAGALVIAAVLVAAVLAIGPTNMSSLFTNILTRVQTYFTGQLPGGS
jgi:Flp pilus assembly pilin Flp